MFKSAFTRAQFLSARLFFCTLSAASLMACQNRQFNKVSDSNEKSITSKTVYDKDVLFRGIYVDELLNEASQSRFCVYFAETPMMYSEKSQTELPAIDQFLGAIERRPPEGLFSLLEPKDGVPNTPFSPSTFLNTLGLLENEFGVGSGIFGTLKSWGANAKLAKSAVKEGALTAHSVLQIHSATSRALNNVTSSERNERIEIETRTIFSKEAFPAARILATKEFAPQPSLPTRASNSGGRDLKGLEGQATFELLIEAFQRTPRDPLGVNSRCKNVDEMENMLKTIKGKN
jgi:hypothetical protein